MALKSALAQTQEQRQAQLQRLTAQQMMAVKMLEMSLPEFEQAVQTEINDNPALEAESPNNDMERDISPENSEATDINEQSDENTEQAERQDELDAVLENMGNDDEMPTESIHRQDTNTSEYEGITYGNRASFYDLLRDQMGELELTETQQQIMEYAIGSLDSDGLLRKSNNDLCDELAIYNNVYVTEDEIEDVIRQLQHFDPAGIGARSLQECLLLQLERKGQTTVIQQLKEVIEHHFHELMKNHWERISRQMQLSDEDISSLREELMKLNPKPGASLGETEGHSTQQITPEFIIETTEDGTISFSINQGELPELSVSSYFTELLEGYKQNKKSMNRQDKEALIYAREKVNRARNFIEAIRQRQQTLRSTMSAIIDMQPEFFRSGDDGEIHPMTLKDVSDRTGLAISTISRVCSQKYCQTSWGMFRLKHFFSEAIHNSEGETLSTKKVKQLIKEMIDAEDRNHPLNDTQLSEMLKEQGFPVARRTVTKYREQMSIATARMRRV